MQDLSPFFWQLMHNVLTMSNEDLLNTVEYRAMYLSTVKNDSLGIHIGVLAKDQEQIEEIKYMRPLDNSVEYVHPYLIFSTVEDLLFGLRDLFDMLEDDRAAYMQCVIKEIYKNLEEDEMAWLEKKMSFMTTGDA